MVGVNVINNKNFNENKSDIKAAIEDLFNDAKNKCAVNYAKCMNEVQRILSVNLKE